MLTALHSASGPAELEHWATEFGITHFVGLDTDRAVVWDLYSSISGRPQYAVLNRNLDIVFEGRSRTEAEEVALVLLDASGE